MTAFQVTQQLASWFCDGVSLLLPAWQEKSVFLSGLGRGTRSVEVQAGPPEATRGQCSIFPFMQWNNFPSGQEGKD